MPQGEEEASQTEGAVPSTPSPVLFSSDDQAVPLGEEECEEIGCQGQGGAGGEGAKDKLRGFIAEEPGGWMDSTMALLGDEVDQCITIRKIKVPAGSVVLCPARLDVGLGDFMVVPWVHLLSDTLLMHHICHASGGLDGFLSDQRL